jgi:DNA-3-methyladenine glycosylase
MRLDRTFYSQPTLRLAKSLLGKHFVHESDAGRLSGWIVEVEAYLWRNDPACHAARGITNKNRSMFAQPGTLYIYCIHSCWCMNVVSEIEGRGAAVLIRAIEPIEGINHMLRHRKVLNLVELTNGPGKLCQALGLHRQHDGIDLVLHDSLWIEEPSESPRFRIARSPRIGIRQGTELLYRYFVDGNRYVSGRASCHSGPRNQLLGNSRKAGT